MSSLSNIIKHRINTLERATHDLEFRAAIIERCKRDPHYFINDWVWTSDPRNAARGLPVNVPFTLWSKQESYLSWRRECQVTRKFGIVAKSRDSGMSWINAADHAHHLLFDDNYKGALGSRKNSLVDKLGDPDTLFQKVRFILGMIPQWMKPTKLFDGYLRIINEDSNNVLTGEGGDNIGRGGRNALYDVDEFAFVERQKLVLAALSQNTDTVILTSTPNGNSDEFSKIYLGDSKGYSRFTFHWKEDPRKNTWITPEGITGIGFDAPSGAIYPWYEEQKEKLDPLTIAQEIDIDFSASMEGICILSKWVEAAIDYPIIGSNFNLQAGLDVATEGGNLNVFTIVDAGNKVTFIETWKGLNTTETAYRARDLCHQHGVRQLNFDADGVGAGVAGTLQTTSGLNFYFTPFHGGSSPSNYFWSGDRKTSKDKFVNRRAELWYMAREKFRKTYETKLGIRKYHDDECISIPNNRMLINQLSQPLLLVRDTGKMLIESKSDMRKRGASSPDFADSALYALASDNHNIGGSSKVISY